jgi:hypothetical protein
MGDDKVALLRLWREKRGEVEPEDLSGNLVVQLGVVTEPLNRLWYERNTGQASSGLRRRIGRTVIRWIAVELINPERSLRRRKRPASPVDNENVAGLFSLWTPRLSKPKAFPAPVFIDEFDSGSLQCGSDCFDSRQGNLSPAFLKIDDRREPSVGRIRKLRLRDFQ